MAFSPIKCFFLKDNSLQPNRHTPTQCLWPSSKTVEIVTHMCDSHIYKYSIPHTRELFHVAFHIVLALLCALRFEWSSLHRLTDVIIGAYCLEWLCRGDYLNSAAVIHLFFVCVVFRAGGLFDTQIRDMSPSCRKAGWRGQAAHRAYEHRHTNTCMPTHKKHTHLLQTLFRPRSLHILASCLRCEPCFQSCTERRMSST